MDFGDLSENPFAVDLHSAPRPKRRSISSAIKLLLLVVVAFVVVLLLGHQSKRWVAHQLTRDFQSLNVEEKQTRLVQIAELDTLGIEPLVNALADENMDVARTAHELLRQNQNRWTILERAESQRRHLAMVDALESVAVYLPDDRTGWGTSLLQQTLMSTIDQRDDASRQLYQDANHAMELLSISDRAGPSILSDDPLDPKEPRRLVVRSQPLPVSAIEPVEPWTDWPPPADSSREPNTSAAPTGDLATDPETNAGSTAPAGNTNASVYRSSARLQPIKANEAVILRDVASQGIRVDGTAETAQFDETSDIRSVTHLVDSPMETFDDKSVVHWLGSPHRALREKAKAELISRGFGEKELTIATQIASGDPRTRIAVVDSISHSNSIDPRPWLLMMLDDESRDVKLRVISVLATMNDPNVSQRLRMHLVDESDPTVAARIRRVLDLR